MKNLIFGDLHLGVNFGSYDRSKEIYSSVIRIIKKNIDSDNVFFCGDIFNNPRPTPAQLQLFGKIIYELDNIKIPTYIICGNHDYGKSRESNSLLPYKGLFESIHIIDDYFKIDNFVLVPYGVKPLPEDCDRKTVIFSHRDTDRNPQEYDHLRFKYNFNGHIHKSSEEGKLINVGSIIPCNQDEAKYSQYYFVYNNAEDTIDKFKIKNKKMYKIEVDFINNIITLNNNVIDLNDNYINDNAYIKYINNNLAFLDLHVKAYSVKDTEDKDNKKLIEEIKKGKIIRNINFQLSNSKIHKVLKTKTENPEDLIKEYIRSFYKGTRSDYTEIKKNSLQILGEAKCV